METFNKFVTSGGDIGANVMAASKTVIEGGAYQGAANAVGCKAPENPGGERSRVRVVFRVTSYPNVFHLLDDSRRPVVRPAMYQMAIAA
jgi:hypothetical protein